MQTPDLVVSLSEVMLQRGQHFHGIFEFYVTTRPCSATEARRISGDDALAMDIFSGSLYISNQNQVVYHESHKGAALLFDLNNYLAYEIRLCSCVRSCDIPRREAHLIDEWHELS